MIPMSLFLLVFLPALRSSLAEGFSPSLGCSIRFGLTALPPAFGAWALAEILAAERCLNDFDCGSGVANRDSPVTHEN